MSTPSATIETRVFGCWMAIFALATFFIALVGIVMASVVGPKQDLGGTRVSLWLHHVSLWSPFLWMGWGFAVASWRRLWSRTTGLAVVRSTDSGWTAIVPSAWALFFASMLFTAMIFVTGMVPLMLLGKRNPWWVWAIAWPVAGLLAWWLNRRLQQPWMIVIDEAAETITFPRGRGREPLTLPWANVISIEVVLHEGDSETSDDYQVTVVVRVGEQVETLHLGGTDHEMPSARFVAWLRERLGKAT